MNTDPLRDYFDVVAIGRTPTTADLAATIDEALAGATIGATVDRADLERRLTAATTRVMAAAREGHTGEAKALAADELAAIRATSTRTPDRVDPDVAAAVAAIPRSY